MSGQTVAKTPGELAEQGKTIATADMVRKAFLENAMRDKAGRRWLHDLIKSCGVYRSAFVGNNSYLQYEQGQRSVGLTIVRDLIAANETLYSAMEIGMIQEDREEERLAAEASTSNRRRSSNV